MRRVFTIGETVFDIIFKNGKIHTGKAGGSMLNSSVSLGRLGLDVSFITEIGTDDVGELVVNFLNENQVSTDFIFRFDDGKTPIALAFLDEHQNASYSFYKFYPKKRLQQTFPAINENDIVLFGSFFSASHEVRQPLINFIKNARDAGAIVIYDPNIRKPHQSEIPKLQNLIFENISLADIIRGSNDDFNVMFGINHPKDAFRLITDNGCNTLVYTSGADKVHLYSNLLSKTYSIPRISPRSTIGAGDNFNAGIIFSLISQNILKKDLNQLETVQWDDIIKSGIVMSQEVCKSFDNYISKAFAGRISKRQ